MSSEIDSHGDAVQQRDVGHLVRWLLIAAIVLAMVVVAMDNRSKVRVGYAFGDTEAAIWIVILAAALAGVAIGWLVRHRPRRR
jgi:uncharacterized integral membrane protein